MTNRQKQVKNETVIFRAPRAVVESLDRVAKLIGVSRSEVMRRLIPDLNPRIQNQPTKMEQ